MFKSFKCVLSNLQLASSLSNQQDLVAFENSNNAFTTAESALEPTPSHSTTDLHRLLSGTVEKNAVPATLAATYGSSLFSTWDHFHPLQDSIIKKSEVQY